MLCLVNQFWEWVFGWVLVSVILILHQILITYLQVNEWQLEGRIDNQILGI